MVDNTPPPFSGHRLCSVQSITIVGPIRGSKVAVNANQAIQSGVRNVLHSSLCALDLPGLLVQRLLARFHLAFVWSDSVLLLEIQ